MFSLVGTQKLYTMVHSELKAYIESKPHITDVWLAEDGSWYFVPMEGCKQHSREEILGIEVASIEEPPTVEPLTEQPLTEETPIEEVVTEETQAEEVETPQESKSPKKQTKK